MRTVEFPSGQGALPCVGSRYAVTQQDRSIEEQAARLDDELPQVFPAVVPGPDDPSVVAVDQRDVQGAAALESTLRGRAWTELSQEWLARGGWASFCYLTPYGFRSYVPALLRGALRSVGDTRGLLHSVVFFLQPSWWRIYYRGADRQHQAWVAALMPPQFDLVCEFLDLAFHAGHPFLAAEALRWGWNRRDTAHHACMHEHYARMYGHCWPLHMDPTVAALIAQIEAAFANGTCPPDDELCGSDQGDEPAGYALEFRGQDWRTLHPEFLANNYAALSFLSDSGKRYFLPAFLLADLHEWDSNADPVFDLTYGLPPGEEVAECVRRRLAGFEVRECEAIVAYLRHRAADDWYDRDQIKYALRTYWLPRIAGGGDVA